MVHVSIVNLNHVLFNPFCIFERKLFLEFEFPTCCLLSHSQSLGSLSPRMELGTETNLRLITSPEGGGVGGGVLSYSLDGGVPLDSRKSHPLPDYIL